MKEKCLFKWQQSCCRQVKDLRRLLSILVAAPTLALAISCEQSPEDAATPISGPAISADASKGNVGINVLLNTPITDNILKELGSYGHVIDLIPEIRALTMRTTQDKLSRIQKLAFVKAANPDAVRKGSPVDAVPVADFSNGLNTWNLDAVNVTELGDDRTITQDATGVYIGVLDTGLLDSWRFYFPEERIAEQYAKSFGGGGGEMGNVIEQPNTWEHDQNSHGTHVTSTIIGFNLRGRYLNGVAPKATIIPVKVLNQTNGGWGWSSVIARGIVYLGQLKAGPLKASPVIINMSLGGGVLDAVEQAAVDYAISQGAIIVASAGNSGLAGMGYPGAYEPVIGVASAGLNTQFSAPAWWYTLNVPDPTSTADFFISDFSSRPKPGQDLDVTAPGENIVGPYQINSGQVSYYYLSGTSMASPHVAGIVALMAQKSPGLTAEQAERVLESVAIPFEAGSRVVTQPNGTTATVSWENDAPGHGFITADAAVNAGGY